MGYRPIQDVVKSMTNQPPQTEVITQRMETLREAAHGLVTEIYRTVPDSREQHISLVKLEECVMWAIKGIALNQ